MCINTCTHLGIVCEDAHCLNKLQYEDGSWKSGWIHRYGSIGIDIQNLYVSAAAEAAAFASHEAAFGGDNSKDLAGFNGKALIRLR